MAISWMQRMREAGLPPEQAEAIASMPEEQYVTRDYLDAKLDALRNQLLTDMTWRMLGIAALAITVVGLLDKLVRP